MNYGALFNAYPVLIAVAGFIVATALSKRAVSLMPTQSKAALLDSTSRSRPLILFVLVLFFGLAIWRPFIGWLFLACAYIGLGVRSTIRLQRLNLPAAESRLVLVGNWCAVSGVVVCALSFCSR
jgi:hypothetical protein